MPSGGMLIGRRSGFLSNWISRQIGFRLPWRKRNKLTRRFSLSPFNILVDRVNIMVEFRRVFLACFAHLFDYFIFPHKLILPATLPAYKLSAVQTRMKRALILGIS